MCLHGYRLYRDTDALLLRAQIAPTGEEMQLCLINLRDNLGKNDMTYGHSAIIFKTPDNDLYLNFFTINSLVTRLDDLRSFRENETAYQIAFHDLRDNIRDLPRHSWGYFWTKWWPLVFINTFLWLWPIIVFLKDQKDKSGEFVGL